VNHSACAAELYAVCCTIKMCIPCAVLPCLACFSLVRALFDAMPPSPVLSLLCCSLVRHMLSITDEERQQRREQILSTT